MSHFKHHYLALLPLLSILSMSPAKLENHLQFRSLASVEAERPAEAFPCMEELLGKINRSSLKADQNITAELFAKKSEALKQKVSKERKEIKQEALTQTQLKEQQKRIQDLVSDYVIIEEEAKLLKDKKQLQDEPLKEIKNSIESLISDVQENEIHAKPDEDTNKGQLEVVAAKKDDKKEEVKPSSNPEICALQEQNKLLSKQVEELLADQKKINESLVNITSALAKMVEQQQNPWASFMSGPQLSHPQQYPIPQNMGGQWIYVQNPQQGQVGPQYQVGNLQDQSSLGQLIQQQQALQGQQDFTIDNGLGMPQVLRAPAVEVGQSPSFDPLSASVQFMPGNFGESTSPLLANKMVNFSPATLMM